MRITLRSLSWLVGAAALGVPGLYVAVQLHAFNTWANAQEGGVCGMPVLGIWLGALAICALLSGGALVLNGIDLLRRSQPPRPIKRYAEFAVLAAPAACVGLFLIVAMVAW